MNTLLRSASCVLLAALVWSALGQCPGASWSTSTGGAAEDQGYLVLHHSSGDLFVAGRTESGIGGSDVLLSKFDIAGNLIWAKALDVSGDDVPWAITEGAGGTLLLGGVTSGFFTGGEDGLLMRLDTAGQELWSTRVLDLSGYCQVRAIRETSDGVFIAGSTNSIGQGNADAFMARFTASGTLTWLRVWGGSQQEHFTTLDVLGDGTFIAASQVQSYFGNTRKSFFMRVDPNGNVLNAYQYGAGSLETTIQMQRDQDGSYMHVGFTSSFGAGARDVLLMKTDSLGDFLWAKAYGTTADERGIDLVQLDDGGWLITAVAGVQGKLVKVDPFGTLEWVRQISYHDIDVWANWADIMTKLPDGSVVVTGTDRTNDPDGDLLLMRLNGCGEWDCPMDTLLWQEVPAPQVQQSITPALSTSISAPALFATAFDLTGTFVQNQVNEDCGGACTVQASLPPLDWCATSPFTMNASVTMSDGDPTYWAWDMGDGTLLPDSGFVDHAYSQPGVYMIQLVVGSLGQGCLDTAYAQAIIGNPVNAGPDTLVTICAGSPAFPLGDLLAPGVGGGFWVDPNGDPAGSQFSPSDSPSGTYLYIVPDVHCASDTALVDIQVVICTGLQEMGGGVSTTILSTGAGGFEVGPFAESMPLAGYRLLDAAGRFLVKRSLGTAAGSVVRLDLPVLSSGVYFLMLDGLNGVRLATYRVVVP